jgi:hypothetical protein
MIMETGVSATTTLMMMESRNDITHALLQTASGAVDICILIK